MEKNLILKLLSLTFCSVGLLFTLIGLLGSTDVPLQTYEIPGGCAPFFGYLISKLSYGANGKLKGEGCGESLEIETWDNDELPTESCSSESDCFSGRGLSIGGFFLILLIGVPLNIVWIFSLLKQSMLKSPCCACMGRIITTRALGITTDLLYFLGVILALLALPTWLDGLGLDIDAEIAPGGFLLIFGLIFNVVALFLNCFVSETTPSAEATTSTATV